MMLQLFTCICFASMLIVASVKTEDPVEVQIEAECKERISKANLPSVVTSSFCCMKIIRCFCYGSLCKSETVKFDVFCNVTVNVQCGSVAVGSRCKEVLNDFATFCANADAQCATDDNVKPYVSSTNSVQTVTSTGASFSVGLIVGISGVAFLILLITIAFVCIFCTRESKAKPSTNSNKASKSSLKVQKSSQSNSVIAKSIVGFKSNN